MPDACRPDAHRRPDAAPVLLSLSLLMLAMGWDLAGLDLPAARWFGGPEGFPWRDQWLLSSVMHQGGRVASWCMVLWLCVSIWWPMGLMKRIDAGRRLQLTVSSLLAVLLVSGLKSFSTTSCPWDLAEFGRTARYVSHWAWLAGPDGGTGRCFPAGHASAGFAFLGGYFAFRENSPSVARAWLLGSLAAGLLLGIGQQMRGAHFMSHTLWSACACWTAALAAEAAAGHLRFRRNRLRAV